MKNLRFFKMPVILGPNGGNFTEIQDNDKPYDVKIGEDGKIVAPTPGNPAQEGYKFLGWFTTPDNLVQTGAKIEDINTAIFEHTTRLYAHYSYIKTAGFDANGGTFDGGETEYTVTFTDEILYEKDMPVNPTREGYVFEGWYEKDEEGKEHKLEMLFPEDGGYVLFGDEFSFYAKWTKADNSPEEGGAIAPPSTGEEAATPQGNKVPATGDESNILFFLTLTVTSLILGTYVYMRKNN